MRTLPQPTERLRLGLASDSELVTQGLMAMLAPYANRVRIVPAGAEADVTLVDPTLSDVDAWLSRVPRAKLVFYTWNVSPAVVATAFELGIGGCLTKHLGADRLVLAVEHVHRGRVVIERHAQPGRESSRVSPSPLTPREASVIRLITNGLSNDEIAQHLNLSINSVKSYIRSTYRKIEAQSRAQAVVWGVRHGYLSDAEDVRLGRVS